MLIAFFTVEVILDEFKSPIKIRFAELSPRYYGEPITRGECYEIVYDKEYVNRIDPRLLYLDRGGVERKCSELQRRIS